VILQDGTASSSGIDDELQTGTIGSLFIFLVLSDGPNHITLLTGFSAEPQRHLYGRYRHYRPHVASIWLALETLTYGTVRLKWGGKQN
jgi:hypothetical protein